MLTIAALLAAAFLAQDEPTDMNLDAAAAPGVLQALGDDWPVDDMADWSLRRRPLLLEMFQQIVYGRLPAETGVTALERTPISVAGIKGAGSAENIRFDLGPAGRPVHATLILPKGDGPHPVIMQYAMCGAPLALPGLTEAAAPAGGMPEFCERFAGMTPPADDPDPMMIDMPVEELLAHGYGMLAFAPGDIVPDDGPAAISLLEELSPVDDPKERLGALAAWGWGASRIVDVLEMDERVDQDRIALMGHSRNGKAAIVAAAYDRRIDLVWIHQSGTGGVTLSRSYEGESVENITGGFPHWLAPRFRDYADHEADLPIDQHQMLALIAPRPVLIGAAYGDTWAGPKGAWLSAQGADPVYELLGTEGLNQASPEAYNPHGQIAYFIREGRHGTSRSDWDRFIEFLDAHFNADSGRAY
ncbi:hypothetical protein [Parvularcula sp. LCG005]|uniref:glucuronyl esterase domain-containing protein n=1 Tax=Parvularcula sp. LCG005 TaxID=3078805 RepID=UPI00294230E8|nr:hypothetical protein [Parvularcula sp. LCG005]WOI53255.1 hypothetical protein RUI03_14000 [Parvularcula sp. LCG005]